MSWVAVGMAGAGLAKGELVDKPKQEAQATAQAATTRYSPWTHMTAAAPTEADPWGNAIAGAASGLAMEQNNKAFDMNQALKQKLLNSPNTTNINTGGGSNGDAGSFWSSAAPTSAGNPYNTSQYGLFGRNY